MVRTWDVTEENVHDREWPAWVRDSFGVWVGQLCWEEDEALLGALSRLCIRISANGRVPIPWGFVLAQEKEGGALRYMTPDEANERYGFKPSGGELLGRQYDDIRQSVSDRLKRAAREVPSPHALQAHADRAAKVAIKGYGTVYSGKVRGDAYRSIELVRLQNRLAFDRNTKAIRRMIGECSECGKPK